MPKTTDKVICVRQPSKFLITIDPGKASGFAVLDYTYLDDIQILYSDELEQFAVSEYVENMLTMNATSDVKDSIEIVMEKFTITPQTGKNGNDQNWSPEIIGSIRYMAHKHGVKFTEQTPAEAKSFVPNDRMKAVGIWHVGGEGHAKDALRHGVLYLVKRKGWRPPNLLAT